MLERIGALGTLPIICVDGRTAVSEIDFRTRCITVATPFAAAAAVAAAWALRAAVTDRVIGAIRYIDCFGLLADLKFGKQ